MTNQKTLAEKRDLLNGKLWYSAKDITNAVEKAVLEQDLLKEDSYEMNSLLMDVLSNLNHYNKVEHEVVFSAINDSKLHKEQ